jgi:archaellum component FlaC
MSALDRFNEMISFLGISKSEIIGDKYYLTDSDYVTFIKKIKELYPSVSSDIATFKIVKQKLDIIIENQEQAVENQEQIIINQKIILDLVNQVLNNQEFRE